MALKKKTAAAKRKTVRNTKPRTVGAKRSAERANEPVETTSRLHELVLRCAALRDSGKHSQARKLLARVEQLQQALQDMEQAIQRAAAEDRPLK